MSQENENQIEIIDSKVAKKNKDEGIFSKAFNEGKIFANKIIEKVSDIPDFAKEIVKSSDKSNNEVYDIIKTDQDTVKKIIEAEIEKENPSVEQLEKYLEIQKGIRNDAIKVNQEKSKHNTEILAIVGGLTVTVLTAMISNRNKA